MRTLFNGVLFLFLSLQIVLAKDYLGAELRTKEGFVYGRFEINYKSAGGTGVLSNFFVYHDFTTSTADWNEIDIEILSRYDDDIQCTTIVPRQFIHNSHTKLPFNPHEDFYSYAFEWTPDYVAWFVEGEEIYRQTGEHIKTLTRPSKIMMNLWADDGDGTWTGPWIPETLPYFAYYDWVAYYEWTPDSGNAGTDDNFTFRWRDDFAEWDTVRWEKATHTWGGNRVQFTPDNAVFEDGKLILCLTEAENSGYTDVQAPSIIWARAENNTVHVQFSEKVDSLSALDKSKYSIPGAVIDSVFFDQYKRSVLLKVTGLDAEKEYSLVLFGLSDLRGNVQSYSFKEIVMQEPLSFPIKINVGGESIYNGEWLPDQKWAHDVEYGRMDGYDDEYPSSIDIANTEMDSVYLQGVHEINRYRIRVPDGIYSTTLHFTENKFSAPGDRAFDINIEDEVVLTQLDVYAEAGQYAAHDVKIENISVEDGILEISFNNSIGDAILFGLTVEQISTSLPTGEVRSPKSFRLYQNFPNPFNPETTIRFKLPHAAFVRLNIYDARGALIHKVLQAKKEAGQHDLRLNLNLASGIYFYELDARTAQTRFHNVKKMVLLK